MTEAQVNGETSMGYRAWKIGDRVVDPTTGERGAVFAIQQANPPWHNGGCPLVRADSEQARNCMGHAWHDAVPETDAQTCETCGGVTFTPTCTHDKHVEARMVERIVQRLRDTFALNKNARMLADYLEQEFHPKHRTDG
jgi:hypothetical protein